MDDIVSCKLEHYHLLECKAMQSGRDTSIIKVYECFIYPYTGGISFLWNIRTYQPIWYHSSQSLMWELQISHVGLDSRYMSKCIKITIKIYTEWKYTKFYSYNSLFKLYLCVCLSMENFLSPLTAKSSQFLAENERSINNTVLASKCNKYTIHYYNELFTFLRIWMKFVKCKQ